jgi:hypothetical protein
VPLPVGEVSFDGWWDVVPRGGRLSLVRRQPDVDVSLPGPAPELRGEVRPRRRQGAGRHGPHRSPQPSPRRRGLRDRRGGQGPRPGTPVDDLVEDPPDQPSALHAAGVLPGRPCGLRRPRQLRCPRSVEAGADAEPRGRPVALEDLSGSSPWRQAATHRRASRRDPRRPACSPAAGLVCDCERHGRIRAGLGGRHRHDGHRDRRVGRRARSGF